MIAELSPSGGRCLPLKRAALIPTAMVRAARGLSAVQVSNFVEAGGFVWVFDIAVRNSSHPYKRELRFLVDELTHPENFRKAPLAEVIRSILGERRATWSVSDFGALTICSHQHVYALLESGALKLSVGPGRKLISRASIESFLTQRRIGA